MKHKSTLALVFFFAFVCASSFAAELLSLVPYDASLVVNLGLNKVVNRPEIRSVLDSLLPAYEASFDNVFAKAGINPVYDIHNVLFFIDKDDKFAILADGSFDAIKTCEVAQTDPDISRAFTLTAIGGLPALKSELDANANIVFVDQQTLAFGDLSVLEKIGEMSVNKNIKTIQSNRMFTYMLRKLDLDTPQLWGAAMSGKKWFTAIKTPKSGIDNVRITFFSLAYDQDFTLDFTSLVARNSQLQELVDSLSELINGFKVYVSSVEGMSEILDNALIQDNRENLARVVIKMPIEKFTASLLSIGTYLDKK